MIPDDLVPADCPWPIVLGLDPGTRRAGYGAIVIAPDGARLVTCGVIDVRGDLAIAQRLAGIQEELDLLLLRLRPSVVAIENAFSAQNVHSALRLGEARGMMMAAAARRGLEVVGYAPAQAKKAVLGNGAADKSQIAAMIVRLLGCGDLDVPFDATDALAVALAHAKRLSLVETMRRTAPG